MWKAAGIGEGNYELKVLRRMRHSAESEVQSRRRSHPEGPLSHPARDTGRIKGDANHNIKVPVTSFNLARKKILRLLRPELPRLPLVGFAQGRNQGHHR